MELDSAGQLIRESQFMVALTGAGISTDSGIPDFRSPNGLWSKYPVSLGDFQHFKRNPGQFFAIGRELLPLLLNAKPNKGHHALRELEDLGLLKAVITQNIDGLHQMAGSKKVIEIHGTYKTATCLKCTRKFTFNEFLSLSNFLCPECSGIVKPDVVMFGENLPHEAFSEAVNLSTKADLMLVAGSSLEVYPANNLVLLTRRKGHLIIVNDTETALDGLADIILRESISSCLPRIVEILRRNLHEGSSRS